MKKTVYFIAIASSLLLSSCVPATNLYTWYNYEDLTYQYSKVPTDELQVKVLKQYEKMEKQRGLRKVVPPGLYAEYGFLLCKKGETEKGLEYMKKEIALYPESNVYISRIIKQLEK